MQAVELALEDFPSDDEAARNRRAGFAIESLRIEFVRHLLGLVSFRQAPLPSPRILRQDSGTCQQSVGLRRWLKPDRLPGEII